MRKLLLATSALLSASVAIAGAANAATLTPNAPVPAPGTYAVNLGGFMEAAIYTGSSNYKEEQYGPDAKIQNYTTGIRARLAPSFAATLASGLTYGATFELRHQTPQSSAIGNAAVYVDRENAYVGSTKFGTVTYGGAIQPTESLGVGQAQCYVATCGWDGDFNGFFTGTANLRYFAIDTNDNANKIAYTSPSFSGFQFGISFEPNDNAKYWLDTGSERVTSYNSLTGTDYGSAGKRRNTFDGNLAYKGTFGSFGVAANVGGSASTAVVDDQASAVQAKKFSMITAGLELTAAGFTVGGNLTTGDFSDGMGTLASGAKGSTAIQAGASYAFGPFGVGASYYGFTSGEFKNNPGAGSLRGYGVTVGGTYTMAPGATVYLEGIYGTQKVNGFDLSGNGNPANFGRSTDASGVGLGTIFKW